MKLIVVFLLCFFSFSAIAQLDITKRNITVTNKLVVAGNKAQYKTKVARSVGDSLALVPFWVVDELKSNLDSVIFVDATSTNNTTINVDTVAISNAELITVEVSAIAILNNGDATYNSTKTRTFSRSSSGTLTNGALYVVRSDEYLGTGLSTATFSITNLGSDRIIITWTGESGKTIYSNFRYTIQSIKINL